MRIIEYFEQTKELQKDLREQIVQADWRAAKYPKHRGNRYSEKLIRYACCLAKQDGYGKVYLSSNEVGLYEKYGFIYLKRLHTLWGEETQVFEKEADCSKYDE